MRVVRPWNVRTTPAYHAGVVPWLWGLVEGHQLAG